MTNILRKQMVAEAVGRAVSPITIEHVAKYLPDDFELDTEDLAPHVPAEAEPAPQAQPFDWGALANRVDALQANAPAAPEAEQATAEPEAPAVQPGDVEAATARRIAADSLVANARVALITAQNVEKDARTKLANAVTQFQSGFAPVTPEQLRRDHVNEQAAIRQAQKDGTLPVVGRGHGIGKSVVDRMAAYSRGGNPAQGNYRRGAYPSQMRGAPNYDPRRGPVVKPPSVR